MNYERKEKIIIFSVCAILILNICIGIIYYNDSKANSEDSSYTDIDEEYDDDSYDYNSENEYYSSRSSSNDYSSSSDYSSGTTGEGGYEMPNESDKSFSDYVKRVDPDLYDSMQDRYDSAVDNSGY